MAVAASGILTEPLDEMGNLFAALAAFQTWTGAANTAAAQAFIFLHGATGGYARPMLAITRVPGGRVSRGGYASGTLQLIFEEEVSADYRAGGDDAADIESGAHEFLNSIGAILQAAMAVETGGTILIPEDGFTDVVPYSRTDVSKEGTEFHQSVWHVDYGLRG